MKTVAPYVFPMKKYFGNDRNIQYECFNKLVQDFEKEVTLEGGTVLPSEHYQIASDLIPPKTLTYSANISKKPAYLPQNCKSYLK